jgi:hypothetical protein
VIETQEHEGVALVHHRSAKYPSAQFCETLPFAFRSTEWDDVIVDVHEKTTTIEVPDSVYPPAGFPGQHSWQPRVSAAPVVVKKPSVRSDDLWREQPCDLSSNTMVVTPALLRLDPIWDPVAL